MAVTPSSMLPIGTIAPDFKLIDTVSDRTLSLDNLKSDVATVIMFICNHCPFVIHVQDQLVDIANEYQEKGVKFIAINSNDIDNFPDDAPEHMKRIAQEKQYPFPYLFDETQEVAKAYHAACTPDIYVFDSDLKCVYRGQLDDSRPGNDKPVDGADLRAALDSILAGEPVSENQKPSQGCNIKWK